MDILGLSYNKNTDILITHKKTKNRNEKPRISKIWAEFLGKTKEQFELKK